FFLKREIWIWHRDGVVHRLNGGANSRAPVQPVNNAGQAIQVSKPAVSPISQSAGRCCAWRVWKPATQQTWKSALLRLRLRCAVFFWKVERVAGIEPA